MEEHNSVLKRERQNAVRRMRNRVIKSKVHTSYRRVLEALNTKDKDETEKKIKVFHSELDKAVKRGVIHKNRAARNKSRLSKKVKKAFEA